MVLEALNKWREKGFDNKLVTLRSSQYTDADVLGNNPIYKDEKLLEEQQVVSMVLD